MRLARRLLLALWAGGLVTIGAVAAPTLFAVLPDRALAGAVAGALFREAAVGSAAMAAVLATLAARGVGGAGGAGAQRQAGAVGPALLLAASEWGVRPMLAAARMAGAGGAFAFWHGLATVLYVAAAAWVVCELVGELRR